MCTPNPCKHFGICNVTGPSSYSCDCNGTRYTGATCEIGIIEIPDYPSLIVSTRTKFTLFANPDYNLIVKLKSSAHVQFSPKSGTITFSHTQSSADIFITGTMVGIYTISYEISGKSSLQFQQPQPDIVIVQNIAPTPPIYFTSRGLESGMLEAGSCDYANPLPYTCPNEEDRISFSSTCRWHGNASPGLIFSTYKHLNVPVAITGAKVGATDQPTVIPLTEKELKKQCNFVPMQSSCTFKPSDVVQEIENFLNTEALATTFLNQVEPLIPRWLQFSVISSINLRTHDSTSYMINLVERNSVSKMEKCSNIFVVKDGMYSVLVYSGILNFNINSSSHGMISQGSPICFAVNLCEGLNSPLFIAIPDEAKNIVNSLSFAQIIRNYGWELMINSIAISSTSFSHEFSGGDDKYWFGNQEETYAFLDSTIVVDGRFTHSFSLGTMQINYSLDGRTYMLYPNFDMVCIR